MAHVTETGTASRQIYEINGTHRPDGAGPAPISFEVDGHVTHLNGLVGSHHVAACLAAFAVMVDADARGVTDLEIVGPDLFSNHANDVWRRLDPLLADLHPALKRLEERFDRVSYR